MLRDALASASSRLQCQVEINVDVSTFINDMNAYQAFRGCEWEESPRDLVQKPPQLGNERKVSKQSNNSPYSSWSNPGDRYVKVLTAFGLCGYFYVYLICLFIYLYIYLWFWGVGGRFDSSEWSRVNKSSGLSVLAPLSGFCRKKRFGAFPFPPWWGARFLHSWTIPPFLTK